MSAATSVQSMNADDILAWLHATAPSAQLSSDSRSVRPGDVFFAYPGDVADGRNFIEQALANGARAVVYEAEGFSWNDRWQAEHLAVPQLKKAAGPIANVYYGAPDRNMFSVAVTGTNGKTSCTQWLGKALSRLGQPTAVIGTLGVGLFERGDHGGFSANGYTTPDAVLLQRALAQLCERGAKALAIEASSIGIDQGRMNGMHIDVALFTNFTRDHLDYHGDMAAYEAAKRALFDWPGLKHAVINLDDEMGMRLVQYLQHKRADLAITGYTAADRSVPGIAVLRATDIRSSHAGTAFKLDTAQGSVAVKIQLIGQFNVSNVLGILGVLLAKGIAFKAAVDAAEALTAVPGRMQQLGGQEAPLMVIDYAHTPDALEKTIASLRQVAGQRGGQLWCVFGCGGDRDPGKRPQMGAVAQAADHVIVTSDNPRNEDPSVIIAQVVAGIDKSGMPKEALQVIEDRAAAILWAGRHAAKNDVVLLAGKGHESYQEIKGKKLPFLDADHAALALAARATMKGTM
ncbi:UDP-N-acetylmuramoyl-L-alanyl-D-glutamate--2,6-diaminopimelate ligase [Noviherbaspirillum sp. Root189]|uniref:UDP-N-acetylmuramoyl-L-alanyl-D-glutamate--2, 6-diaminopimelate ligase n=1 Tax=Noviherbaspirillum sp. Root189 TaxID=1736487 RepID=UPI00070E8096|nr:UDP-N-acetylmuramoyl-L-alanyl-D-glutamate--2,6-diaminopimelate ligase [Noviherbaspirillum sp. Root189]KRB92322.1 UDP-N-acetylmuramoylalanyl-D-glutamate--2,6-diaminopimelate ligase [Noviherbaspirillum sp. Root189]